jgi:hypothetical protein
LAYSVATRRIPRTTAIEPFYDPDLVGRQAEAAREWQQAADQVLRENPLYDETRTALAAILDKAAIEIELFEEDWEKMIDNDDDSDEFAIAPRHEPDVLRTNGAGAPLDRESQVRSGLVGGGGSQLRTRL